MKANRKIKFRVWDKLSKTMIYPNNGYQGHYILSLNGEFHNLQNGSGGDDYIVQQFTGFKDKKGKEIYEGDFLLFKLNYQNNINNKSINIIDTVEWIDGTFFYDEAPLFGCDLETVEIVGNIFENPELIKEYGNS